MQTAVQTVGTGRTVWWRSLTVWIFIGLGLGIVIGFAAPRQAHLLAPFNDIFLRLIKSVIGPLLFGTLVAGIAGAGSTKSMGRVGLKAILCFEVMTTVALFLGLAAANLSTPGKGLHIASTSGAVSVAKPSNPLTTMLDHTFPASVIDAMARGEILQIVVFSLLFGIACATLGAKAKPVVHFCESLAEIMFRYTKYVMWSAPPAVAAAIAISIASNGPAALVHLAKLILAMAVALLLCVLIILLPIVKIAGVPIRRFISAAREPTVIAFSTASSEAALPVALTNMEWLGAQSHIAAFVLPIGYSLNLIGSTLYLSLASIFIAQAAGIHLSIGQQLFMMGTLMLTSKGVGGIPRGAFVVLFATLPTFGLPAEGATMLLGVDVILDMMRAAINVLGNCVATAAVARWEGASLQAPTVSSGASTEELL